MPTVHFFSCSRKSSSVPFSLYHSSQCNIALVSDSWWDFEGTHPARDGPSECRRGLQLKLSDIPDVENLSIQHRGLYVSSAPLNDSGLTLSLRQLKTTPVAPSHHLLKLKPIPRRPPTETFYVKLHVHLLCAYAYAESGGNRQNHRAPPRTPPLYSDSIFSYTLPVQLDAFISS